jgi:hypothetical protein
MKFLFYTLFLIISWTVIYFLNTILLEWSVSYAKFLSKNGFSIHLFQIKWYTVRCNRLFMKISNWKPLKIWFNLGVLIGVIGQTASIFLLLYTLFDFFKAKSATEQILVPVVRQSSFEMKISLAGFTDFLFQVAGSEHSIESNALLCFIPTNMWNCTRTWPCDSSIQRASESKRIRHFFDVYISRCLC